VNRSYLDSHADTSVVGRESIVIQDFDHPVTVSGFDPTRAANSLIKLSAALANTMLIIGSISRVVEILQPFAKPTVLLDYSLEVR
jgi:hypothetical protein